MPHKKLSFHYDRSSNEYADVFITFRISDTKIAITKTDVEYAGTTYNFGIVHDVDGNVDVFTLSLANEDIQMAKDTTSFYYIALRNTALQNSLRITDTLDEDGIRLLVYIERNDKKISDMIEALPEESMAPSGLVPSSVDEY